MHESGVGKRHQFFGRLVTWLVYWNIGVVIQGQLDMGWTASEMLMCIQMYLYCSPPCSGFHLVTETSSTIYCIAFTLQNISRRGWITFSCAFVGLAKLIIRLTCCMGPFWLTIWNFLCLSTAEDCYLCSQLSICYLVQVTLYLIYFCSGLWVMLFSTLSCAQITSKSSWWKPYTIYVGSALSVLLHNPISSNPLKLSLFER